jgi:hypothetical protein
MVIITSLSPFHSNFDSQIDCVKSWKQFGKVYSLNTYTEIDQMRLIYENDVTFIETEKTIKYLVGKNLITINAMVDLAIQLEEDLLLINSDITIDSLPELKQDGITIFSRWDYTDHYGDSKMFQSGFDGFFVPKTFLSILPHSIFAMGNPWWDFNLPLRYMEKNIPVYWEQQKYMFHKIHPTQYDYEQWVQMGEYFRLDFKLEKHLHMGQIATQAMIKIKQHLICL